MAVTVVSTKGACVVEPGDGLIAGGWFIEPIHDHPRFKAVMAKCGSSEIAFYRNMIRNAVDKEGHVERILQHLERQSVDLVIVEREPKFNFERIRYVGGGREFNTECMQIVKVDDSIDSAIVQRAMDHARDTNGVVDPMKILQQLLDMGVLRGELKLIKY